MKIETLDRVFAIFLFLLGLGIAYAAPSYGYMIDGNPGPGFFPLLVGLAIAGLSMVNFVRSVTGKEKLAQNISLPGLIKPLGMLVVLVAFVFLVEPLGMILACAALVLAIGWIIHPHWDRLFAAKLIATAVLFPVAGELAFGVYLGVPLPKGLLGI